MHLVRHKRQGKGWRRNQILCQKKWRTYIPNNNQKHVPSIIVFTWIYGSLHLCWGSKQCTLLLSKQIKHEGYGNPLLHNNNNNNRKNAWLYHHQSTMGEHSIMSQLWVKKYDQGSQASFGFSKHVPNIQTKKIKRHLQCSSTKGERHFVCLLNHKNHFAPIGGPGGCEWLGVNDIIGVLNIVKSKMVFMHIQLPWSSWGASR